MDLVRALYRRYKQPLYDTSFYPTAGCKELIFFDLPMGSKVDPRWKEEAKSECDTNLAGRERLGPMQEFQMFGFRLHVPAEWDEDDIAALRHGVFKISLGPKKSWRLAIPCVEIPVGRHCEDFGNLYRLIVEFGVDPRQIRHHYDIAVCDRPALMRGGEVLHASISYDKAEQVSGGGPIKLILLGILSEAM